MEMSEDMFCPKCGKRTVESEIEYVNTGESVDMCQYFECATCGHTFQYDIWPIIEFEPDPMAEEPPEAMA